MRSATANEPGSTECMKQKILANVALAAETAEE
jgi:hypothetical protein